MLPGGRRRFRRESGCGLRRSGFWPLWGQSTVEVFQRPRAGIISTGDELVPVSQVPRPGQVRDVNTHTLAALIREAGGVPAVYGLVEDRLDVIADLMKRALSENDMIFLSGGSSVGMRDLTVAAIERFSGSELLVHGVSVSPGKPTILATVNGKPVWGAFRDRSLRPRW